MTRTLLNIVWMILSMLLCHAGLAAENYAIQIAALSKENPELVSVVGEDFQLFADQGSDGLIRYRVGNFDDIDDANLALETIRARGFLDAYIVNSGPNIAQTPLPVSLSNKATNLGLETERLRQLPTAVRQHVVYLDGELHVKKGDTFMPLDAYLANNASE